MGENRITLRVTHSNGLLIESPNERESYLVAHPVGRKEAKDEDEKEARNDDNHSTTICPPESETDR